MKTKEQINEMVIKIQAEATEILMSSEISNENIKHINRLLSMVDALNWVRFEIKLYVNK